MTTKFPPGTRVKIIAYDPDYDPVKSYIGRTGKVVPTAARYIKVQLAGSRFEPKKIEQVACLASELALIGANGEVITPPSDPDTPPSTGSWFHPLPGATFTSPYGQRGDGINGGMHYGVDLSTGTGTVGQPVLAPTAIRITQAVIGHPDDYHFGSAGNYVKGHALDGSYTFNFFHLSSLSCSVGDIVQGGVQVGIEGTTGNSTGLHLHLETYAGVHDNPGTPPYGDPIDPVPVFAAKGVVLNP